MWRRIFGLVVVLGVLLGVGHFWSHWQKSNHQRTLAQPQSVAVNVAKVGTSTIPNQLTTVGTLDAKQNANISSDLAGKVVAILYQPGTFVKQGTPLIQLDDRTYRANQISAQAAFTLAQTNVGRYQALIKTGALAQQTLDQAHADFQQAKATLDNDNTLLSETVIRAPFDGYVGAKTVSIGDYVTAGQTLTSVVDRHLLQVNYNFPEKYLPRLKVGQSVILTLTGSKHFTRNYQGTVSYISPSVDENTHSVAMQADVPNPDNSLSPGLFVMIKQIVGVDQQGLVIPQASLVPTITGPTVYTVVNQKAKLVSIKTGVTMGDQVQVLQGLKNGDTVIVAGQQMLKDGEPVEIVN